jgi:hypothetical protein
MWYVRGVKVILRLFLVWVVLAGAMVAAGGPAEARG